jgi:hypothetical protein
MTHTARSLADNTPFRQARFEELSRQLAERELDLATLEGELAFFERTYARRVGSLYAELDRLEAEIARELYRLYPDPEHRTGFHAAAERARTNQQAVDEKLTGEAQEPPRPSEELRSLYRKVAKAIHPDFATDEEDRAFRTHLMARANAAYKRRDKAALEQILQEWENRDASPAETRSPTEGDLLERQIARILTRIREIDARIAELKESDLYQLMLRVEQAKESGRDLLGEMAGDIQTRINGARELIKALKQRERA